MKREKFFKQHQYYYFGEKKPARTVERKDSAEPDGRHKIELQLSFDTEEAQQAVLQYVAEINNLHEVESLEDLADITTWLAGYLAALLMAEVVDMEQAEQLKNLLNIASQQQARRLNARYGKRG